MTWFACQWRLGCYVSLPIRNKITMILISVGVSIGSVGLPLLTENYVKRWLLRAAARWFDSMTMLMYSLLPAAVGVVMVGEPLYTVFYGKSQMRSGYGASFVLQFCSLLSRQYMSWRLLSSESPCSETKERQCFTLSMVSLLRSSCNCQPLLFSATVRAKLASFRMLMCRFICQVTGARRGNRKRTILITIWPLPCLSSWLLAMDNRFCFPTGDVSEFLIIEPHQGENWKIAHGLSLRTTWRKKTQQTDYVLIEKYRKRL